MWFLPDKSRTGNLGHDHDSQCGCFYLVRNKTNRRWLFDFSRSYFSSKMRLNIDTNKLRIFLSHSFLHFIDKNFINTVGVWFDLVLRSMTINYKRFIRLLKSALMMDAVSIRTERHRIFLLSEKNFCHIVETGEMSRRKRLRLNTTIEIWKEKLYGTREARQTIGAQDWRFTNHRNLSSTD